MTYRSTLFQLGKTLILISVVTGGYFLLGLLGLLFRIPDNPVWIIMPSAGLALAATLLLGVGIIPAVVIGNICVCAWFFNFNPVYLNFYVASAIGAAFSAWIGCRLVHLLIGFPNPLVEGKKIMLFFCFVVPMGSLISAVIGITAMYGMGVISSKDILLAGLNWWVADILGILIFTPLILILFADPQHIWYRRRATVGLPIVLTFALVVALFFYMEKVAEEQYKQQLKEKTITLSEALKNRIQLDLSSIHALRNFLLGSHALDSQQFSLLAQQTLFTFKEMQVIRWVRLADAKGGESQPIVTLGEQPNGNLGALQAIPSDIKEKLLATPPISEADILVVEKDAFKLYTPITNGQGQNKKILGVIVATVSVGSLVQQSIEKLNTAHCPIALSTAQAGAANTKTIYSNAAGLDHNPCYSTSFDVAGQEWLLSFYHDWDSDKTGGHRSNERVVYTGFWFTGILGLILLHLTGRNFRTEALIDERTRILTETKVAAEQANQSKNQFLANISHELRTPLNGISGFTQLLEKKPNLNAEDKKQVAIIKQCSDDLLRLINDILDISAIETQQIKLEISDFNFTMLLNDSTRICRFRADEKGLKLFTKNTCLPEKFMGDEKRIRQILVNLIDNAVKYTSQGSVTVSASYQNGLMKISVTDTGPGIAQKDLERIFSPFIQLSANSFTHEGIGLGLSITKELVHLMGGEVGVSSQLGLGSIFSVSLPLPISGKSQVRAMAELPNKANLSNAYVLVVDDSEINLIFLVSMLGQLGCQVDSAMDGQEALALIEQNQYHFALIDINMPVMNGLELVKRLRIEQSTLKLVAVSAYADDAKISEALDAGFDSYITKPIKEHQLVEIIQASLS